MPMATTRGQDRDDPDDRDARPPAGHDGRLRNDRRGAGIVSHACLFLSLLASQIRRGSKDSAASIVSTTTAAKKSTPGPGSTDISG